jgi:ketosteroid isomerase-like protein
MDTKELATGFVALIREGKFDDAITQYLADDVVSIEASEEMKEARGIDAVRAKGEWWDNNHEMHGFEASDPYVNGDQFAIHMKMDATAKESGQRFQMEEIGLYTVRNGKIVEEKFLYGGM